MELIFHLEVLKYKNIYIKTKKINTKVINMVDPGRKMREIMKEYERQGMRPAFPDKNRIFKEGRHIYDEYG